MTERSSKEIKLSKGETEREKPTTFEIIEVIPFSPEENLTGMFVCENETYNRLLLKGTPESIKTIVKKGGIADFNPKGLQTVVFAEAKLDEKKWNELKLHVNANQYRREQNSTKVTAYF